MLIDLKSPNFATAIGPIIGGALAQRPGWRWIFWVLAIASGVCLLLISLFLPETSRATVGNGSQKVMGLHRTLFSYVSFSKPPPSRGGAARSGSPPLEQKDDNLLKPFRIPNPLKSLKMLWAKDTALITLIYGVYYMNFSCLQASISTLFIGIYGLSELKAGLVYLPFGIGSCIGAYLSGSLPLHTSSAFSFLLTTDYHYWF